MNELYERTNKQTSPIVLSSVVAMHCGLTFLGMLFSPTPNALAEWNILPLVYQYGSKRGQLAQAAKPTVAQRFVHNVLGAGWQSTVCSKVAHDQKGSLTTNHAQPVVQ